MIKNNIHYLNKYLTRGFLETKNIFVTDSEAETITKLFKRDWNQLYQKNYGPTFEELKKEVRKETYESVLSLYLNTIRQYL